MSQLQNRNIVVFGISADTVDVHRAFAQSERLNFSLLADPGKKVVETYGALGANGLPERVTFIVGPDGTIRGIDGNVDAQFARTGSAVVSRHGTNLALLLSDWKARLGTPVPNFFLPDYDGKTVSPFPNRRKAAVIVFLGAKCPVSRAYADTLRRLAVNPVYKDVTFLGISANADEAAAEMKAFAEAHKLPFPIARDAFHEVTDRFGVAETPTAWVLDGKGVVVYHGAIDNGKDGADRAHYVREALDAALTGRPVPLAVTKPSGTAIRRERQIAR